MTQQMTGAEMVIQALLDQGVEHIFGYPGGAVLPIYDAMFQQDKLQHILVRHEQGAVHAAEGYARSTGKVGVRAGDLGSGRDQCGDRPHRRADGFDPAGLHHRPGADASDRQRRVPGMRHGRHHAALHQAQLSGEERRTTSRACCTRRSTSRRTAGPGPVVVDIPKDVQFATGTYLGPEAGAASKATSRRSRATSTRSRPRSTCWRTPSGRSSIPAAASSIPGPEASHLLREFARLTGFPVTSTLMGLGAFPAADPQWLGMLGMHGTYEANWRCTTAT